MQAWTITILSLAAAVFLIFAVQRVVRVHRRQADFGREALIGQTAVVRTALSPRGTVFVRGELWTAVSQEGLVEADETVTITNMYNLVLFVSRKASQETAKEASG